MDRFVTQKIQKMLQSQSWERLKAEFQQIKAVSYYDLDDDYNEWRDKCERREELFQAFVKAMEEEELYLF